MALDLGNRLDDRLLPAHGAGLLVEAVDAPFVLGVVEDGLDVAVQPDLEAGVLLAADRRADAGEVAPDDRARQAEARHGRLPGDALALRHVPRRRERKPLADAGGADAAELRPVDAGLRVRGGARVEAVARRERQSQHCSRGPESQIHEVLLRGSDANRITAVGYTGRGSRIHADRGSRLSRGYGGHGVRHEAPRRRTKDRSRRAKRGRHRTRGGPRKAPSEFRGALRGPPLVRCHSPAVPAGDATGLLVDTPRQPSGVFVGTVPSCRIRGLRNLPARRQRSA